MKRTQVQILDPLYEDVKRVAERRDWSVSEVFRQAVEEYVTEVPELREEGGWVLPQPRVARNPNWRIVECRPVMERVWEAAGVTDFATRNAVHFAGFGFERVFDPLVPATSA